MNNHCIRRTKVYTVLISELLAMNCRWCVQFSMIMSLLGKGQASVYTAAHPRSYCKWTKHREWVITSPSVFGPRVQIYYSITPGVQKLGRFGIADIGCWWNFLFSTSVLFRVRWLMQTLMSRLLLWKDEFTQSKWTVTHNPLAIIFPRKLHMFHKILK